jgi:thermitase
MGDLFMDTRRVLPVLAALALLSHTALGASFDSQWALENRGQEACSFHGRNCQSGKAGADLKAKQAWSRNRNCRNILTAVLDTGVDKRHPDLSANLVKGKNFVGEEASDDAQDDNLHGTHVTGIIAGSGDESRGVVGVCQNARILPVKVASAQGYLIDSDIIEGVEFAISKRAQVVNGSFGGTRPNQILKDLLAGAKDTLFVLAAGNGNRQGIGFSIDEIPVYPAAYDLDNLIVVAATDNRDNLGRFSNFGVGRVHLAAPGVAILSTMPMEPTAQMRQANIPVEAGAIDGTSMATPYVTGAATLLWSRYPGLRAADIKNRVLKAVDKIDSLEGKVKTGGRLNLAKLF